MELVSGLAAYVDEPAPACSGDHDGGDDDDGDDVEDDEGGDNNDDSEAEYAF